VLNETATAVLELCDGKRTVDEIAEELGARYGTDVRDDVRKLLDAIAERGLVDGH
jgi:pyrroloquinoline quinone biosynthesis protein D